MDSAARILPAVLVFGMAAHAPAESIVSDWAEKVRETIDEHPYDVPPVTAASHAAALCFAAAWEAWATYDPVATSELWGQTMDGAGGAPTEANKAEAISHAIDGVLVQLVPSAQDALAAYMDSLGYDTGAQTPAAIVGRAAAQAVVESRHFDGSNWENQYADTTGYTPQPPSNPDPTVWRPVDEDGLVQKALTPQWGEVRSFSLPHNDMFRPPPPPEFDSAEWHRQIREAIDFTANLTDEQKSIVEYWCPVETEGTYTLFRGMHITNEVSRSRGLDLDDDIKLFFLAANAVFDAGISSWESKYRYDYVRPYTAVRALGDLPIMSWGGPGEGTVEMPARHFQPYHLITPPFPEYTSGHAAFSASWAMGMRRFFGTEDWDFAPQVDALLFDGRVLDPPIVLHYGTFYSTAEDSGISRLYGAVHWREGYVQGREKGRRIGSRVFQKSEALRNGTWDSGEANLLGMWGVGGYSDLGGLVATTTHDDGTLDHGLVVDDARTGNRIWLGTEEALLLEVDRKGVVHGLVDVLATSAGGMELARASVPVSGRARYSARGAFPGSVAFDNRVSLHGSIDVDGRRIKLAIKGRERFSATVAEKRDLVDMSIGPGFATAARASVEGIASGRARATLHDGIAHMASFDPVEMSMERVEANGRGIAKAHTAFGIESAQDGSAVLKTKGAVAEKPGTYLARAAAGVWRARAEGTHPLASVDSVEALEAAAHGRSLSFSGPASQVRLQIAE